MGTEFDYSNYYYNRKDKKAAPKRGSARPQKTGTRYSAGQKRGIAVCAAVIVLFVLGYIIFKSAGIGRASLTISAREYYAVCLGTYAEEGSARVQSERVRARGAAGFIAADNNYKVLASCYKTKKEAESVIETLKKGLTDASLYLIKIPALNLAGIAENARDTVSNALNAYDGIYSALYAVTVGIDTGEFGAEQIVSALNALIGTVGAITGQLNTLDGSESGAVLAHIKALYISLGNILSSVNLAENYFDISLALRYNYLKILFMFTELFKEINM